MGQMQYDSIGRLRPVVLRKSYYALEVLPKQAKAAAQAWASDFARLPTHEQQAIIVKLTVARCRYWARRMGYPPTVFTEVIVRDLPGGGYEAVEGTTRPLRHEYGGSPENDAAVAKATQYGVSGKAQLVGVKRPKRKA